MHQFESINVGYNSVFQPGQLSIGIVVPIETYAKSDVPSLNQHLERAQLIDQLGFKALWLRDIPFHVPRFGDAGQLFDPFTYLGYLAGLTDNIALGIASIALPLRHPALVAKSAATVDQLSDGRLILGVASGDRMEEYPAMGIDYEQRGELFREAFDYIRNAHHQSPVFSSSTYGTLDGQLNVLPKPTGHKIPMLVTGSSRQSLAWNAEHGDGWMNYPRSIDMQEATIAHWRELVGESHSYSKPFMQPLYIDLHHDDDFLPKPIHLGFKTGINYLISYFNRLRQMGVNHVALNLRFNSGDTGQTLAYLAEKLLPHFHINN